MRARSDGDCVRWVGKVRGGFSYFVLSTEVLFIACFEIEKLFELLSLL